MVRLSLTVFFFTLILPALHAQNYENIIETTPHQPYDNILVKQLDSDELASTFLIWVKHDVKEHYHAEHTEVVYIVEGKGEMTLGREKFPVRPGDYVNIPKGTHHSVKVTSNYPMKALSIQTPAFDGSDRIFVPQQ